MAAYASRGTCIHWALSASAFAVEMRNPGELLGHCSHHIQPLAWIVAISMHAYLLK